MYEIQRKYEREKWVVTLEEVREAEEGASGAKERLFSERYETRGIWSSAYNYSKLKPCRVAPLNEEE